MSTARFELELVSQGWLDVPSTDRDPARDDLCSHGESTRAEFEAFWREYDERLERAARG